LIGECWGKCYKEAYRVRRFCIDFCTGYCSINAYPSIPLSFKFKKNGRKQPHVLKQINAYLFQSIFSSHHFYFLSLIVYATTVPPDRYCLSTYWFHRVLNVIQYITSMFGIFRQRLTNIFNCTKYIILRMH